MRLCFNAEIQINLASSPKMWSFVHTGHLYNLNTTPRALTQAAASDFPHLNFDAAFGLAPRRQIPLITSSPGSSCVRPRLVPHARRFGEKHSSEAPAGFLMRSACDCHQHLLHPDRGEAPTCSGCHPQRRAGLRSEQILGS